MILKKYTEQELRKSVKESVSIRGTLILLKVTPAGGNYDIFRKAVKHFNIDTSHFIGQSWSKGKKLGHIKDIDYYLTDNPEITIRSSYLRIRLINSGYKSRKCENCTLDSWNNNPIPLELHHMNGIRSDNRLENIQLLCPNCHAFTPNYRRSKSSL